MSGFKHSALVTQLLKNGMPKIQILGLLMKDHGLNHWQANREVFTYLKLKGLS